MFHHCKKQLKYQIPLALTIVSLLICTSFSSVKAQSNNDDYQKILGDAVNFGIVADHYTQNNDLQSNFATNLYTGTAGHGINPNLSGELPGDFIVSDIDENSIMHITGGLSAKSTFYTTEENAKKIDDSQNHNQATINTSFTKSQLKSKVDAMIEKALDQGLTLSKHDATVKAIAEPYTGNTIIDTTKCGADSTIYVDADDIRDAMAQNGKFKIKKLSDQTIVFNFTKSEENNPTLQLVQYEMIITKDDGNTQTLSSAPDSSVGVNNNKLAPQCKHIVFNVASSSKIKNVVLQNTAGIFLLNGASASVGGTSSGWIVTNKSFENANGEWHNIYQETKPYAPEKPQEVTGHLSFTKTFAGDKVTEDDLNNISFHITGPEGLDQSYQLKDMKQADNTYRKELKDIPLGQYTIEEINSDKVDGYKLVKNESVTKEETTLTKTTNEGNIDLKDTYEKDEPKPEKPEEPDKPKDEKGSLTFTKTFSGDKVTEDDLNNISFQVKGPSIDKTYQLKDMEKQNNIYSKTIRDIDLGSYTITEINSDKVDGYKLVKDESVTKEGTTIASVKDEGKVDLKDTYEKDKPKPDKPEKPQKVAGRLSFTKTFSGDKVTEDDLNNISFHVTGPEGLDQSYQLKDMKQADNTYCKELKDIPLGQYTIEEINSDKVDGYKLVKNESVTKEETTLTKTTNEGNIDLKDTYEKDEPKPEKPEEPEKPVEPDKPKDEKGSLTFTKTFSGDAVKKDDLNKISFVVTGPNDYHKSFLLEDLAKEGKNYQKTLGNLDFGTYQVVEQNASVPNYTLKTDYSVDKGKVTIDDDHPAETVTIRNHYEEYPRIKFSKKAINGSDELSGAHLEILNKDGKPVDTWVSSETMHETVLGDGTYTMHESAAPNGFNVAKDISFTIQDGKLLNHPNNTITMYDSISLSLVKYEYRNGVLTDKPVVGAKYGLFMAKAPDTKSFRTRAQLQDAVDSSDWLKVNEAVTDQNGMVTFNDMWALNDKGLPVDSNHQVVSNGDLANRQGLKVNTRYAILELEAPQGSQRTMNPAIVEVNNDGSIHQIHDANGAATLNQKENQIVWKETVPSVKVSKVDQNDHLVDGAVLELHDQDGKIVDRWTTSKVEPYHHIYGLLTGSTYTLHEVKAPEGYQLAKDMNFTVHSKDIDGTNEYVQTIDKMVDMKAGVSTKVEHYPNKPSTSNDHSNNVKDQQVKTGDRTNIIPFIILIAASGITLLMIRKRKNVK